MYDFAVVALLALAAVKVVDYLMDAFSLDERGLGFLQGLLTIAAGIGAVWALDYSLFAGWNIPVRTEDIGVILTGFVVAGFTVPWRAVFGYLTQHKATVDETLGEHRPLRRVA